MDLVKNNFDVFGSNLKLLIISVAVFIFLTAGSIFAPLFFVWNFGSYFLVVTLIQIFSLVQLLICLFIFFKGVSSSLKEIVLASDLLKKSNRRLIEFFNTIPRLAIISVRSNGDVLFYSDGAERLFGYKRDEINNSNVLDLLHPKRSSDFGVEVSDHENILCLNLKNSKSDDAPDSATEKRYFRKDGSFFIGELRTVEVMNQSGTVDERVSIIFDVTERFALNKELKERNAFLKILTNRIPTVLYQYHSWGPGESYFSYCSAGLEQVFELKPEEVINHRFNDNPLFKLIEPEDMPRIIAATMVSAEERKHWICEFRINLPKSGKRWIRGESYADCRENGEIVWYGAFIDITEIKRREEEFRQQAIIDELTGIFNRRHFMEVLSQQVSLAKRHGTTFSLILFDLDHFKSINDRCGHEGGDTVLREACAVVSERIRVNDVFCRIGGEEFAILCPCTDGESAAALAETLRLTFNQIAIPGVGGVTASFGVACFRGDLDRESILRYADLAAYKAKNEGRNRVKLYDADF